MDRLTVRVGGNVVTWAFNMDFLFCVSEEDYAGFKKLMEKLAAYEDTGLKPEEIRELLNDTTGPLHEKLGKWIVAEREGRLVVLPCKVGDTVFAELSYDGGCSEIDTGKVFAIGIDERGTMWVSVRFESGLKYHYPSDNIGKDVFLTRAEAEAALEKMKGE